MRQDARSRLVLVGILATTPLGCGPAGASPEPALATAGSAPADRLEPGRGTGAGVPGAAAKSAPGEQAGATAEKAARHKEGEELIGTRALEWSGAQWIQGGPLALEGLRGRVVLVRWWTAPDCPLCAGTAPSLNAFHDQYKERGLVVVGFYHHKSDAPLREEDVVEHKARFGFAFPVAIDPAWKTLRAWWLSGPARDYTSVSFLIDRKGVIQYIHPGGKYARGDKEHDEVKATIEKLLAEPAAP
jgi:peroxiredoxin